jgi:hypothetical protein
VAKVSLFRDYTSPKSIHCIRKVVMPNKELKRFEDSVSLVMAAIRASWCKETSYDGLNWSENNPSYGQCAVSCMVFSSYIPCAIAGGKVFYKSGLPLTEHYWLRLFRPFYGQKNLDLTYSQFGKILDYRFESYYSKDQLLKSSRTKQRYNILREKVNGFYTGLLVQRT